MHRSFKLLDGYADSTTLGHTFSQFVSHRGKIFCCSISGAEVLSFTNHQEGRKKIGVSNVDVRQQRAIHQQSWLERLPSSINGIAAEDKVQCPKLSVKVHKYFKPEYEIQVSHMHYSKVWPKPFGFCIITIQKLVSAYLSKIIIGKTQLKNKRCPVPTNITWRKWAGELIGKPIAAHQDEFSR